MYLGWKGAEEPRFEVRSLSHSTCNDPPPPTSSRTRIVLHAELAGTLTIRPEVVGWAPWVIWHRKVPPSGLWLCGSASTWQRLLRARKKKRGLPVVTGTKRTSCVTPERLRPSNHYPHNATAHCAARANQQHVPHWCCILAEVVYGTVATRRVPLSTTAAVAAMVALCTWRYGRMWVLV